MAQIINNKPNGSGNFIYLFLLGVISSKWWVTHNKKRIRIYLPESKRYIANQLKLEFGGTISSINRDKYRGLMWQVTSTDSLCRIKKVAKKFKSWLPSEFYEQLTAFLKTHAV